MRTLVIIAISLFCLFLVVFVLELKRRARERKKRWPGPKSFYERLYGTQPIIGHIESVDGKIPEGTGAFGLCKENPVPVNGIMGEAYYLSRLRTMDGRTIKYKRVGVNMAKNIGKLTDLYKISVDDQRLCFIYLCPYYTTNSDRAPERILKLAKD